MIALSFAAAAQISVLEPIINILAESRRSAFAE